VRKQRGGGTEKGEKKKGGETSSSEEGEAKEKKWGGWSRSLWERGFFPVVEKATKSHGKIKKERENPTRREENSHQIRNGHLDQ